MAATETDYDVWQWRLSWALRAGFTAGAALLVASTPELDERTARGDLLLAHRANPHDQDYAELLALWWSGVLRDQPERSEA